MGSRRAGIFLSLVALAVGGCGDDDDNGDSGSSDGGTDTQATTEQDAQAKGSARTLVTFVEACYADQMDYSACEDAAAGAEEVGEATVESAGAATYTIVSPSESGNEFRIEKTEAGATERTCETKGEGGCGADGSW